MDDDQQKLMREWFNKNLRRSFTVRADEHEPTELLMLSIDDLYHMRLEFEDSYEDMFKESFQSLHKAMSIKLLAISKC